MPLQDLLQGYMMGQQLKRQQSQDANAFAQQTFENAIRQAQLQRQQENDAYDRKQADRSYEQNLQRYNDSAPMRQAELEGTKARTTETLRAPERQDKQIAAANTRQDKQIEAADTRDSRNQFQANLRGGMTMGAASAVSGYKPDPAEIDAMVNDAINAGTLARQSKAPQQVNQGIGAAIGAMMPGGPGMGAATAQAIGQMPAQSGNMSNEQLRGQVMQQRLPAYEEQLRKQKAIEVQKQEELVVKQQRSKGYLDSVTNRKEFQEATQKWRMGREKALVDYRSGMLDVAKQNATTRAGMLDVAKTRAAAVSTRNKMEPAYTTVKSMYFHLQDAERRLTEKVQAGDAAAALVPDPALLPYYPEAAKGKAMADGARGALQMLKASPEYKEVLGYDDPATGERVPGMWDHYNSAWNNLPDKGNSDPSGKQIQTPAQKSGKPLDRNTAMKFLKAAGGDKVKARKMATDNGYGY